MKSNNQQIKLREFHIDNFPSDRIFVYLKKEFHKQLFLKIKEYKFKKFNHLFNNKLNWSTFKQWRIRRHFIPLWFIIKFSKIFSEFSIKKFEKILLL
jgi:hypothetical protein